MAWAASSEKPMRFCASRTWSANGPPPGTMTIGRLDDASAAIHTPSSA